MVENEAKLETNLKQLLEVGIGGQANTDSNEQFLKKLDRQLKLEEEMHTAGVLRANKEERRAKERSREHTTTYGLQLLKSAIEPVSKEIKDIVSYATQRHITIIPEIELPGHSQAAIASYPWLSCTGKKIEVANDWGVFKEIYCAGKDSVFLFLENVLSEVMELFPSKYIHIGGDEAPKVRWDNCSKCQKRINEKNLKDAHELQSYFIKRVEAFLNKNGRKV